MRNILDLVRIQCHVSDYTVKFIEMSYASGAVQYREQFFVSYVLVSGVSVRATPIAKPAHGTAESHFCLFTCSCRPFNQRVVV